MVVSHNLAAMNNQRQLSVVTNETAASARKLSSGYRVNIAADDAAGLAISEKMRKQIRGLNRASQNAEEGISLIQTAEGALAEVQDMLQRMNELAIQAANGTNSATDRSYIQDEVDQLKAEIDRVAITSKYNEIYLLDGHLADPAKVGEAKKNYIEYIKKKDWARDENGAYTDEILASALNGPQQGKNFSLSEISNMSGIKIIYSDIDTKPVRDEVTPTQEPEGAVSDISSTVNAADIENLKKILKEQIVPRAVETLLKTFPDTYGYLSDSAIGIGLELENDASSDTLASVALWPKTTADGRARLGYNLTVNVATLLDGDRIDLTSSPANLTDNRDSLEVTIVHEMMHAFMDETLTNGMSGMVNGRQDLTECFPNWFIEGAAQAASGGCYNGKGNDWVNVGIGLTASSTVEQIKNTVKAPAHNLPSDSGSARYATGYLAVMYLGYLASGSPASVNASVLSQGVDTILNEIKSGQSFESVLKKYTKKNIAEFEAGFGDDDSAKFIQKLLGAVGRVATGGLATGFGTAGEILDDSKPSSTTKLFEVNPDSYWVYNIYDADYPAFSGGTKTHTGQSGPMTVKPNNPVPGTTPGKPKLPGNFEYEPVTLTDGLKIHAGSDSSEENGVRIYIEGMGTRQIGVYDVDVSTQDGAVKAIDMVAFALIQVSTQRSALGAYQNRLEHTVKNLDNVAENTQAAESEIRDTDMAEEMVNYSNTTILQQAGQSMLAQTNQSNQGVLTLLQ